jgi:hypothetical protein
LIAEAQQGAAGREKFQEAAEIRREASKALALKEDMEMVFQDGDVDAFRRLGAAMGVSGNEVERIAQQTFSDDDDDDDDDDAVESYNRQVQQGRNKVTQQDTGPVDYGRLSPDLQRVLRESERARIDGIVNLALDKDEIIGYNMKAHSPEGRTAIRGFVDEKIRGRLDQYGGDFGDGTRILAEILPEIRGHLQALGTQAAAIQKSTLRKCQTTSHPLTVITSSRISWRLWPTTKSRLNEDASSRFGPTGVQ